MPFLSVLFKSLIILAFVLVIGDIACDNYSAYASAAPAAPNNQTNHTNHTSNTSFELGWEPVAVSKKSLETVWDRTVRLEW